MPTSSLHESFLAAVFSTLGINLNTKKLTLGSLLTVGLTEHLALGSTSTLITLKFLLYSDSIVSGYHSIGQQNAGHSWDDAGTPDNFTLEPQLCHKRKAEAINYILLHERDIWAKSPREM